MAQFDEFLKQLFEEGDIVFREPPVASQEDRARAINRLALAFTQHCLEIAGPALEFRAETALAAAEFVRQACWFLVHRGEEAEAVKQRLMLAAPQSAAEHLAGDLTLRFLPLLHRRAHALAPDDVLTETLVKTLRQWPLSGVLSEVADGPLTPVEFDGHPGLLLLYAERLAEHEKPSWKPTGKALEFVELVRGDS